MRVFLFLKRSKLNVAFRNAEENSENVFSFWDTSIWIGYVKLSLLGREYLSSAVYVLTNSLKILHSTKRDFFELNYFQSDQEIWWRCCRPECNSIWAHLPFCLSKGHLKRYFLDIYLIRFLGDRNFGNTSAMRVFLFLKRSKLNVAFRNAEENSENVFSFWDTSIWIGYVKLSLLRRECSSSAVNRLTNRLRTSYSIKRDFFQPNYVHSDQ